MNAIRLAALALASLVGAPAFGQGQPCNVWSDDFSTPLPGVTGNVLAQAVFDDGSGPALYVGGDFLHAGARLVNGLARWDGTAWSALGGGLGHPISAQVEALCVWDDGSGPALFVGGRFHTAGGVAARNVARWDGTSWTALGSGLRGTGDTVMALAAFDPDGPGGVPARLHAGGSFTLAGNLSVARIAVFDGALWSGVGGGVTGNEPAFVSALTAWDDGSGPALFVGGRFRNAGGVLHPGIARWDGAAWSGVGSLSGPPNQETVHELVAWDDGSGPALFATGRFETADGATANNVARWNGSIWSALAGGIARNGGVSQDGLALTVFDDGGGARLFAGAQLHAAAGANTQLLSAWNGTSWAGVGTPIDDSVRTLAVFDAGAGPGLFVGGSFTFLGGANLSRIARWSASGVAPVGPSAHGLLPYSAGSRIESLAVFDPGTGPELYAVGRFLEPGSATPNLVSWNGSRWSCLASPVGCTQSFFAGSTRLEPFDDGSGPALYVGGDFDLVGGIHNLARWTGTNWFGVGGGVNGSRVTAVRGLDFGGSTDLYVGGGFTTAGGAPARSVARWDGGSWSALGAGLWSGPSDLIVFDDGSGPALFAAGSALADPVSGMPNQGIARWNGVAWDFPGNDIQGRFLVFESFDAGAGPELYVGKERPSTGNQHTVLRWDGAAWIGAGLLGNAVRDLFVFDDGSGAKLYAAGDFPGGLARLEGTTWVALATRLLSFYSTIPEAQALAAYDSGAGERLFVGGEFQVVGDTSSLSLAEWVPTGAAGCPNGTGVPFCTGVGPSTSCPCMNAGAVGRGCAHAQNANGARLVGSGDPSANSVVMSVDGMPLASPTAVLFRSVTPSNPASGTPFGDGLLCVGVPVVRLASRIASGGLADFPINHSALPGEFFYQVVFRNFAPGFCTPEHFNLTNGFRVTFP